VRVQAGELSRDDLLTAVLHGQRRDEIAFLGFDFSAVSDGDSHVLRPDRTLLRQALDGQGVRHLIGRLSRYLTERYVQ
jgi:hypothetical protein